MPGFDRTGPSGEGPKSGRGVGKCGRIKGASRSATEQRALPDTERSFERGPGRGFGNGAGRRGGGGRGRGRM